MLAMWLSGCAAAVSDCPPLRGYDDATQQAMADELAHMEERGIFPRIRRAMVDYAVLRAVIRACRGEGMARALKERRYAGASAIDTAIRRDRTKSLRNGVRGTWRSRSTR